MLLVIFSIFKNWLHKPLETWQINIIVPIWFEPMHRNGVHVYPDSNNGIQVMSHLNFTSTYILYLVARAYQTIKQCSFILSHHLICSFFHPPTHALSRYRSPKRSGSRWMCHIVIQIDWHIFKSALRVSMQSNFSLQMLKFCIYRISAGRLPWLECTLYMLSIILRATIGCIYKVSTHF